MGKTYEVGSRFKNESKAGPEGQGNKFPSKDSLRPRMVEASNKESDFDENVDDDQNEDELDQFEAAAQKQQVNLWTSGGSKKDFVISKIIKYFSSLIVRKSSVDMDSLHEDNFKVSRKFEKAPNASLNVLRARVLLRNSENYDTKDFTIFIAKRKWILTEIRPLMELCAHSDASANVDSDRDLAMRCCKLVMVLIKRMKDQTAKYLSNGPKAKLQQFAKGRENALAQISALLSFKDALNTEKCVQAISLVFADALQKEVIVRRDTSKEELATTISYLRRMMAIDASTAASPPAEIISAAGIHHRLIYHSRAILSAIPSICAGITDKYHDDWLTDIILIIHFALRYFSAFDLFQVWRENRLMTLDDLKKSEDPIGRHVATAQPQNGKGILARMLEKEKIDRVSKNSSIATHQRNNRFCGTYNVSVPQFQAGKREYDQDGPDLPDIDKEEDGQTETKPVAVLHKRVLSCPFANQNQAFPTANVKRSKKNLVFSKGSGDTYVDLANATNKDLDGRRACVVVASMVNFICESAGLAQLVLRVNTDLRRGEGRVGQELELAYFHVLSTLLQYQRLKLVHEKQVISKSKGSAWVPNLENVIHSLDKMSFGRTVLSIQKLLQEKRYMDVKRPMSAFKEMISYLRVLLESSNTDHNEIAVAALYRVFYTRSPTDRQDPMLKLLSEWRVGAFPKEHSESLVELVHEILKTLDTARSKFDVKTYKDSDLYKKKGKRKGELEIQQYISICVSFDVDDYFKKLASNHTLELYFSLLSKYNVNDLSTNHYLVKFLERMGEFRLEEDSLSIQKDAHITQPHLGFMVFNIQSLIVLNSILNDFSIRSDKKMIGLVRFASKAVRQYFELASRNKMMFVEALFRPNNPSTCSKWRSIYDAMSFNASFENPSKALDADKDDDDNDSWAPRPEEGVERSRDFASRNDVANALAHAEKQSDDYGDDFDETDAIFAAAVAPQPKAKKARKVAGDRPSKRSKWTAEEDEMLTKEYPVYADSKSVFDSLAMLLSSRDGGRVVSSTQVRARAKQLGLLGNRGRLKSAIKGRSSAKSKSRSILDESDSDESNNHDAEDEDDDDDDDDEKSVGDELDRKLTMFDDAGFDEELAFLEGRTFRESSQPQDYADLDDLLNLSSDEEGDAVRNTQRTVLSDSDDENDGNTFDKVNAENAKSYEKVTSSLNERLSVADWDLDDKNDNQKLMKRKIIGKDNDSDDDVFGESPSKLLKDD